MIRKYDPDDLDELLDVWYEASLVAHPFLSSDFFHQERDAIPNKYLPVAETWVFEETGRVVGFISLIDNVVGAIFVSPRHHRCGIGHQLMDLARTSRDHLEVEVFKENAIGRAFYDAYGFEVVGERIHKETGQPLLQCHLRP